MSHLREISHTLAKTGVVALMKHIAMGYGRNNIRAYTLALGNIAAETTFNSIVKKIGNG